jgi:cell division septum initiation protein DivIVA
MWREADAIIEMAQVSAATYGVEANRQAARIFQLATIRQDRVTRASAL